ncbi:MAG: hypothetical protein LAO31_18000 [Acidobacteriia bacterium]|nr:hypothetical protein [Terriglobia bacterium]
MNIEQSGIALRSNRPLGGLRFRDMQVPTNLAGEIVINYGVSGDSRSFLIGSIYKYAVTTAFIGWRRHVLFACLRIASRNRGHGFLSCT